MDRIKIIYEGIYSKYKTNKTNFDIAQINSILYKSSIINAIQYIKFRFREMSILSDCEEYFQKYSYKESIDKLKLLGYIYVNNFKPPPNYLSMGICIYNIMCQYLKEKQNLIDRNIFTNIIKEKKNKNRLENAIMEKYNDFYNSKNFSKSSYSMSSNKNQSFENKYFKEITNAKNKILIFSFPKNNNNKSKHDEKKIKGVKYLSENSFDSIKKWIEHNKISSNNNISCKIKDNNIQYYNKTNSEIRKFKENKKITIRRNKILFSTKPIFQTKNNILELIKNLKKEKINKYRLSIDNFKKKLKQNRKNIMKTHIENYWKTNKKFVTNLIENQNHDIINYNEKYNPNKMHLSTLNSSENSKINNNSVIYNNFKSIKMPLSSKNIKPKHISLNKSKKKLKQNSLIAKIQNDSDFMKNKNFSCVFPSTRKVVQRLKDKNNLNKNFFNYRKKTNNVDKNKKFPIRIMQSYSATKYKIY